MNPNSWQVVADQINARMVELVIGVTDLERRSGVSAITIRRLRNASKDHYAPTSLSKVALALGWTADSIDRILAGGTPTMTEPAPEPDRADVSLSAATINVAGLTDLQIARLQGIAAEMRFTNGQ